MGDLPPEWAWKRMRDLTADEAATNAREVAFARYIAAHEEAPIDPLVLVAREICGQVWERRGSKCAAAQYRRGDFDDGLGPSMTIALACLRRGIEIAGGGNG